MSADVRKLEVALHDDWPVGGVALRSYSGYALSLAYRRWRGREILPRDDYEQEALLALLRAAERYDPESAKPFSAVAFWRIRGAFVDAEYRWLQFKRDDRQNRPTFCDLNEENAPAWTGLDDAKIDWLESLHEGEWFTAAARCRLLRGLSARETARVCNMPVKQVYYAVDWFHRKTIAALGDDEPRLAYYKRRYEADRERRKAAALDRYRTNRDAINEARRTKRRAARKAHLLSADLAPEARGEQAQGGG